MLRNQKAKTASKIILSFALIFFTLPFLFASCDPARNAETANQTDLDLKPFDVSSAVFIGDSNIAHLVNYGLVSKENVLTGSEYYLTLEPDVHQKYVVCHKAGKEMTSADAVALISPELVIITLGTDGALSLDREGFRLSYRALIESIRSVCPETEIAVQSIFPVREGVREVRFRDVVKTNNKFETANLWLSELAAEYGIVYLDTASVLRDESGNLKEEYNTDHLDGYHLNKAGLIAMLDYINENFKGE